LEFHWNLKIENFNFMSRVGKKSISIPEGVEVSIQDNHLKVKGPKGVLELEYDPCLKIERGENTISVLRYDSKDRARQTKVLWGLTRNLINNIILGVFQGFEKKLEIQGVGYRANIQGKKLILELGFSHSVEYAIPDGIEIKVEKNIISVTGIDKQKVGQTAAEIRSFRPPEPYKGKGIRYVNEYVRRKAGKKATTEGK